MSPIPPKSPFVASPRTPVTFQPVTPLVSSPVRRFDGVFCVGEADPEEGMFAAVEFTHDGVTDGIVTPIVVVCVSAVGLFCIHVLICPRSWKPLIARDISTPARIC